MTFPVTQRDNVSVIGDLAATSATVGPYLHRAQSAKRQTVHVQLAGTWVGTIDLQTSTPNQESWVSVGSFTANTSEVLDLGGSLDLRWIFTSRTSGTAKASIIND